MHKLITESDVEEHVLDILDNLNYEIIRGNNEEYLPGGSRALRVDFKDVILIGRLREALKKLNPRIPEEVREQALKQVLRSETHRFIVNNENFHRMLIDGVDIPVRKGEEESSSPAPASFPFFEFKT